MWIASLLAAILLAYANGANDNFKGVATLFGSRTTNYRRALNWACSTTLAGSIAAVWIAQELLETFSGRGLVPGHCLRSRVFGLGRSRGCSHSFAGHLPGASQFHHPCLDGSAGWRGSDTCRKRGCFLPSGHGLRRSAAFQSLVGNDSAPQAFIGSLEPVERLWVSTRKATCFGAFPWSRSWTSFIT